jgi:rare lipoprotein A
MKWQSVFFWLIILMFSACSSSKTPSKKGAYYLDDGPPKGNVDLATVKDAVPRSEPFSKTGNKPYVVFGKRYVPLKSNTGFKQKGTASWYGKKFHGKRTSSGEAYDMYKMTAAHTVLPIPSYAQVTNVNNGRSVIVRINDRGPFKHNRVMDLSYAAALKLDVVKTGTGQVEIVAISENKPGSKKVVSGKAEQQQKRLQADGFSSTDIERVKQNGLSLYRVRLGPLQKQDDIDFILGDLQHAGYADAHIIVETTK